MLKRLSASFALLFHIFCAAQSHAEAQQCLSCHQEEVAHWQSSHHAKAMGRAEDGAFLGRFDGSGAEYLGLQFRFHQNDGEYRLKVSDADGNVQEYRIAYSLGITPLQQYLAEGENGRWQAIPVVWDTRPEKAGGQRWYALESDLSWQHPAFTANGNCIDCHSTGFSKNFDADSDSFNTKWQFEGISCSACHGDTAAHLKWAQRAGASDQGASNRGESGPPHYGFKRSLQHRSEWQFVDGKSIAVRKDQYPPQDLQSCARCHALRDRIEPAAVEQPLADQISLHPLSAPHYFADGQIRGEVFVTGSFLQSKMHAAGVSCSDCHQAHSSELKAEGDALCLRCHQAVHFATPEHHKHPSKTVACVDCHMPATTYMGVDDRRAHRFGIPDPELSEQLGSPSPCRDCHSNRSAKELAASVKAPQLPRRISKALTGDSQAQQQLLSQIADDSLAPVWQGSMLSSLLPASDASLGVAVAKLQHADDMVRAAAIRHIQRAASANQRAHFLMPMLKDPALSVRLAAAEALAGSEPKSEQDKAIWQQQQNALDEQLTADLDVPQGRMRYGNVLLERGHPSAAAAQYRAAVNMDPEFVPAMLALARLSERHKSEHSPLFWLDKAVAAGPQQGLGYYARGLYKVRQRQYEAALSDLARAAELDPGNGDWQYTYAVALENMGHAQQAIEHLSSVLKQQGNRPRLQQLLELYRQKYAM